MLYLGLSGGIGSGKTTVSARLAELGAVVLDADAMAREVVEPGSDGLAEIASRFGGTVLLPDGSLNRPALGAIVFADERARRDLEAITHPRIRELTAQRQAAAPRDAIVVHDVPLLVEGGLAPDYHLTLIVDAAQDARVERIMRDRGMTQDAALARISAQATEAQRHAAADALLDNNGTRDHLLDQVGSLWRERLAPYNENLLADRPVTTPATAHDDVHRGAGLRRTTERVERQLASAGLADGAQVMTRAASSDSGSDALLVTAHDRSAQPLLRAALRAAGFAPLPELTTKTALTFASCDPAAPLTLQLRWAIK